MADSQVAPETKTRLLDAAEELFAERGFAGTSMRQITTAAHANLAAVNYHYGSKEALMAAVLERRIVPINRERLDRLDALEARGGEPTLRELLVALIEPALRHGVEPGGERFLRLVGRLHAEPERSPAQELFVEQFREIGERMVPHFARALPDLEPEEVLWRLYFVVGAMAHTMMCSQELTFFSNGACDPHDIDVALRRLVVFAEGGLRAPHEGGETR